MTVADPAMSWLVGLVLFDVDPPHGLSTLAGCLVAGLTVAIGVALLVNSPTVHDERDREFDDRSAVPARGGVDHLP